METYHISEEADNEGAECPYMDGFTQTCSDPSICAQDCVGNWECNIDSCVETFVVTTAAANGGENCIFNSGDQRSCTNGDEVCAVDCEGEFYCDTFSCVETYTVSVEAQNGGGACIHSDGFVQTPCFDADALCAVNCEVFFFVVGNFLKL